MQSRAQSLRRLDDVVAGAVDVFTSIADPEALKVNREWTAKDALGHLVFWHESFARNVYDLANSATPSPLRGTYATLNQRCLEEMRPLSVKTLVDRLLSAQATIRDNILQPSITMIPYRKRSRDYSAVEHLVVVADHVEHHVQRVRSIANG